MVVFSKMESGRLDKLNSPERSLQGIFYTYICIFFSFHFVWPRILSRITRHVTNEYTDNFVSWLSESKSP